MKTKIVHQYPGAVNIIPYHFLEPCDHSRKCDYKYSYSIDLIGDS